MRVTKVFTRIAVMVAAVCIWKPLVIPVIGVGVVCLMEMSVFHRLCGAFHAREEHGYDEKPENDNTHFHSLHKNGTCVQIRFT